MEDLEEGGHVHAEEKEPSYCGEGAFQSLLWVEEGHGASFEGVGLWASSEGAWEACWGEGVVARGVEGNVACVVGEPGDAEVGLNQAVHQVDHQKGVGGFLEVHLPGYLLGKSNIKQSFDFNSTFWKNQNIKFTTNPTI